MATQRAIDRLSERIDALEQRVGRKARRTFRLVVDDHRRAAEEIPRFRAEHGVSDAELLITRVIVPFEQRPDETALAAYQRELGHGDQN